ncbi:ATP-dependent protease ClpP, protease subunit [Gracilibacillus orientalis]|uniref:ATP-dependent Clp protease proteolytic subunit n=1 Tax=Gracilibacillus orientalis TaxID=334253 RepID=A0A1I4H9N5_9BACI|nr:head maturation protease, ClpP-related [Gracilibacillus orientalis]SFL38998.1 ATP-dependent protease ClpP, protease subunit [Gracilibacillus orientalis]
MKKTRHYPIFMSAGTQSTNQLMTVKNLTETSADLYIYGEIIDNTDFKWDEADVMPEDVLNALKQVDGLDNLNIFINSPGGSVFAGLAIYNMLSRNKAKKTVHVDGVAASMASVIAMVGDTIHIPANAFLMIHNPWTIAVGNANDFRKLADDLDTISSGALNVYKGNLKEGITEETIQELLDNETWLNGEEAAKYFNVEVADAKNYAACASDVLNRYDKTPQKLLADKQNNEPPTVTQENEEVEKIKLQNELDLLSI